MSGEVLLFVAGGSQLGVPLGDVARLTVAGELTPVPFGHRALVGLMRGDDGMLVPVFDLQALDASDDAPSPRQHGAGATVAVIGTELGPVGLRLERLLGTAHAYVAPDDDRELETLRAELWPAVRGIVGGAGRTRAVGLAAGDAPFFFFSAEAFIAALAR